VAPADSFESVHEAGNVDVAEDIPFDAVGDLTDAEDVPFDAVGEMTGDEPTGVDGGDTPGEGSSLDVCTPCPDMEGGEVCTDLQRDPWNCGSCGRRCLPPLCGAGRCLM
jgi:hypothetical protein